MPISITRRTLLRNLTIALAGGLVACQSQPTRLPSSDDLPPGASTAPPQPTAPPKPAVTASQQPTLISPETPPLQPTPPSSANAPDLAVARGEDPARITEAALASLGGMEQFVKPGFDVIIKPNICTDHHTFEYASTTNPVVVATLVRLALAAGAKRVRVMDFPFGGTAASAYARSGIEEAVVAAGGVMEAMNPNKFRPADIPQAVSLKQTSVYQDIVDCDLMINVPIAKHHSSARLTLGCKNLLGVIRNRGEIHTDFSQRIPDPVSLIRPQLTVVDAVRTLLRHGPTGGNLDDVLLSNTVIASRDVVAADAWATRLFDLQASEIGYLQAAAERGLGRIDLENLRIEEIQVS